MGTIRHIYIVCGPEFEIFDERNQLKYIENASCCQCGLLCANNFWGKLSEAIFNILQPESRQIIGNFKTLCWIFWIGMVTESNTYQLNFPSTANPSDKLLIMPLWLMI